MAGPLSPTLCFLLKPADQALALCPAQYASGHCPPPTPELKEDLTYKGILAWSAFITHSGLTAFDPASDWSSTQTLKQPHASHSLICEELTKHHCHCQGQQGTACTYLGPFTPCSHPPLGSLPVTPGLCSSHTCSLHLCASHATFFPSTCSPASWPQAKQGLASDALHPFLLPESLQISPAPSLMKAQSQS